MNVSINLSGMLDPGGRVTTIPGSGTFISVDFTPRLSVILPGFDAEAIAGARRMAAKLHALADAAEQKLIIGENTPVEEVSR